MKASKLFAALGLCAAIAPAAYASEIEVIYNGAAVKLGGEIINDRAMVGADAFEALGVSVYAEDGVWDFGKNDISVQYDEISGGLLCNKTAFAADVMPVEGTETRLFPLRAFAEQLGVAVGWDSDENAIVLIDYDAYFEKIKNENPAVYDLLCLQLNEAEQGIGSGTVNMSFEIPDLGVAMKLDLAIAQSVADGISESNIALGELSLAAEEFDFALENVTLDGVYDTQSQTIYFKTDAIEKIAAALPEDAGAEFEAAAGMFKSGVWYKLTMNEYADMIYDAVGIEGTDFSQMLEAYTDGISFGEMLRMMSKDAGFIDNAYAFEALENMTGTYAALIESGIIKLEIKENGSAVLEADCNAKNLCSCLEAAGILTEEELPAFEAELAAMNLKLTASVELAEGVLTKADLDMAFEAAGASLDLSVKSELDISHKPEPAALPESAVNLMPLIGALSGLVQAS